MKMVKDIQFCSLISILICSISLSCVKKHNLIPAPPAPPPKVSDLPFASSSVGQLYLGDNYRYPGGQKIPGKGALNGKAISALALSDFDQSTNKSRGACETANILKTHFSLVARADKIKCYISSIADNLKQLGLGKNYLRKDSLYNYWFLSGQGLSGTVKFKIKKNSAGAIEQFEIFDCLNSYNESRQSSYTNLTLSNSHFNMQLKTIFRSLPSEPKMYNSAGDFTIVGDFSGNSVISKHTSAVFREYWSDLQDTEILNQGKLVIDEFASTFKVNSFSNSKGRGYRNYHGETQFYSYTDDVTLFGIAEKLNSIPGKISTIALGDGSARLTLFEKNKFSPGYVSIPEAESCQVGIPGCVIQNGPLIEGWYGDDMEAQTFSTSSYGQSEVRAMTPNTTQAPVIVSYNVNESWDCQTISDADQTGDYGIKTIDVSSQAYVDDFTTCDKKYDLGSESNYLGCWQLEYE